MDGYFFVSRFDRLHQLVFFQFFTKVNSMSTETTTNADIWARAREAILERWPQINHDDLAACSNDTRKLTNLVKHRVNASDDEVESVFHEFGPQDSILVRMSHAASDSLDHVSESAQFAHMRADEYIAKRPTESVLTSFVAGIALGTIVTVLWFRSQPEPSTWARVKSRAWN
jgi:ElaB/YqjD/DUF883 family membrane-anchored ribosome-binding protein